MIGSQTLHATGYAMGIQRDGAVGEDGEAVIAYFGDGATSQGDVNEAFVWASVFNAPVVFFCQNNQWAISEPLERAEPRSRSTSGRTASASPACGWTATTCWPVYAVTRKAHAGGPRGPGPDADRGLHLPHGRAHHHRRPDPVPAGRASSRRGSSGTRSSGSGPTWSAPARPTRTFFDEVDAEADELGARVREACLDDARPAAARACSTTCTPSPPRSCEAEREQYAGLPGRASRKTGAER